MATPTYPLARHEDLVLTAKLVEDAGRRCLALPFDVRDAGEVDAAVASTLEEFGRLDIVVANAGVVTTGPLVEVSDACWEEMVATNLTGVFHTLRAVLPAMKERRYGRIIVTSSMGGRMGIPGQAAYNATKWGVIGLAKSVALEVAKEGITVNVVCPATVLTPMLQPDPDVPVPEEVANRFLRVNPIPQPWLQPEDVSRAVVYLATDPGVITGSVQEVGLGSSARMP
jgi:NAD(P)-dependent dehydrogenase (short-subunit alcohol dehydrogenase family)